MLEALSDALVLGEQLLGALADQLELRLQKRAVVEVLREVGAHQAEEVVLRAVHAGAEVVAGFRAVRELVLEPVGFLLPLLAALIVRLRLLSQIRDFRGVDGRGAQGLHEELDFGVGGRAWRREMLLRKRFAEEPIDGFFDMVVVVGQAFALVVHAL